MTSNEGTVMATVAAQLEKLVQGNTVFTLELYHALTTGRAGNVFLSPFSVFACLAMALLGAKGYTADAIRRGLRLELENSETHAALAALQDTLHRYEGVRNLELRIANTLWAHKTFPVLSEFLENVQRYYRGGIEQVDFSNSNVACRLINEWVGKATHGMIPDLLTEDQIHGTLLVLANAIYFRGKWSSPFDEAFTRPKPFCLPSGENIQVPMMEQSAAACYARIQNFQILEKWYGEGEFSMIILLPDRVDGLEALEASLSPQNLDAWLSMLEREDEVQIQLPKFRIASRYELESPLIEMGMDDAFNPEAADFSGITGKRDFFVNGVIHRGVIEVDEEGTKAAAATAMMFFLGMSQARPTPIFHADRPFLFLIRHNDSKIILFIGRVVDPRLG